MSNVTGGGFSKTWNLKDDLETFIGLDRINSPKILTNT